MVDEVKQHVDDQKKVVRSIAILAMILFPLYASVFVGLIVLSTTHYFMALSLFAIIFIVVPLFSSFTSYGWNHWVLPVMLMSSTLFMMILAWKQCDTSTFLTGNMFLTFMNIVQAIFVGLCFYLIGFSYLLMLRGIGQHVDTE